MSQSRHNHIETPFDPKAEGRLCCYCGKPRPKDRRRWCSDECVNDFLVRKGDAGRIRLLLRQRDKEVCARCGFDAKPVQKLLRNLQYPAQKEVRQRLAIVGFRRTLWDADHIVPVVEGGGGCGLENYRTLCLWCHQDETAKLAKRRAQERHDAKRPLLELAQ